MSSIWVRVLLVFLYLFSHGLVHAGHGLLLSSVAISSDYLVLCYEESGFIVLFNIYFFLIAVALPLCLVLYTLIDWVIFLLSRWKKLRLIESLMRWYLIINNNQFSS